MTTSENISNEIFSGSVDRATLGRPTLRSATTYILTPAWSRPPSWAAKSTQVTCPGAHTPTSSPSEACRHRRRPSPAPPARKCRKARPRCEAVLGPVLFTLLCDLRKAILFQGDAPGQLGKELPDGLERLFPVPPETKTVKTSEFRARLSSSFKALRLTTSNLTQGQFAALLDHRAYMIL